MATHSTIFGWRSPWIEEPGGLQSIGSHSQTRLKGLSTSTKTTERGPAFMLTGVMEGPLGEFKVRVTCNLWASVSPSVTGCL